MRRRKRKGADLKLISYADYVFYKDLDSLRGQWKNIFNNNNPIYVELGSGKGKFITEMAKNNRDINFISIERKEEVILKGVEKADDMGLKNIKFLWTDVDRLPDIFEEGEISRIFINFCDPWPKNRWIKRRLTYRGYLNIYHNLLKSDGEVHFKTDNNKLFEFSLNEFSDMNWKLKNISLDLVRSDYKDNITTEYEEKYMELGLPIYRLEAKLRSCN